MPIYYPNPSNFSYYIEGPVVSSLDECRVWIKQEAIRRNQNIKEYDYECGLNCKFNDVYGILVCKETLN